VVTQAVSVAIPSLHGGGRLVSAVTSVLAAQSVPTEVIVADNGLPRAAVDELRSVGANVRQMEANLGFGAAVNRAVDASTGDVLVVMNDDVTPVDGFIERLVEPLGHGADVVAGVLVEEGRPDVIETAGIEIDAALSPYDYLQGEPVSRLDERLEPPLAPCGGAIAFTRSAFLEVGGFDEGFFAYGEDLDLAIRLRHAGARFALAPDARALHASSSTLGYQSLAKARLVGYSRGYLLRKYGVLGNPRSALRAVAVEAAASLILLSRHRSFAPAYARIEGWRSCRTTAPAPPRSAVTVGLVDGLRRRYARSNRGRA
jgi:GT2 family glycosyltransferase